MLPGDENLTSGPRTVAGPQILIGSTIARNVTILQLTTFSVFGFV